MLAFLSSAVSSFCISCIIIYNYIVIALLDQLVTLWIVKKMKNGISVLHQNNFSACISVNEGSQPCISEHTGEIEAIVSIIMQIYVYIKKLHHNHSYNIINSFS